MKSFALTGVTGFVAPRHLKAIRDTGNGLVAAMDRSDSAGILDRYFPQADFFTTLQSFENFLAKYKKENGGIDYFSVCTPNFLHDANIRMGWKHDADVICEKPLVLNPSDFEALVKDKEQYGKEVFNLLQLRLHSSIQALKKRMDHPSNSKADIDLAYITPRGKWYHSSWKGDITRSGGIATNIGIHFFDMLIWIFGKVQNSIVHLHTNEQAAGFLELDRARVRWFLSINEADLPAAIREKGAYSARSLSVDGDNVDFNSGFEDLHTKSYQSILSGKGFGLLEALPSIELVHMIRTQAPIGLKGEVHPMASLRTN
ncbi:MAG: Gfo/Idh/MocA family protein [Flavisolibacter sp.]